MSSSFLKIKSVGKMFLLILSAMTISLIATSVRAQTSSGNGGGGSSDKTHFSEYKGAKIGMSASDVRQKLGKPENGNKVEESYNLSDKESVRVFYDGEGKAITILITYTGKSNNVPTPESVLGEKLEADKDGSMYKMVQYRELGYWVAYSRTPGSDPLTMITIQKMQSPK